MKSTNYTCTFTFKHGILCFDTEKGNYEAERGNVADQSGQVQLLLY